VRLRSTKRERKRGQGWELNGADSWLVWLSTPGRAGLPKGTPTLNPALWIFSPRRWLYPNGAEKRAIERSGERERGRRKERERERERKGEVGRDEGKQKVRFVVRAGWRPVCVLYPVHTCPIVVSATRDGSIFFALIRSSTETTRLSV